MQKQSVCIEYLCPYCEGRQEARLDFDYDKQTTERYLGIVSEFETYVGDYKEVKCSSCNRAFKLTFEAKIVVETFREERLDILKKNCGEK